MIVLVITLVATRSLYRVADGEVQDQQQDSGGEEEQDGYQQVEHAGSISFRIREGELCGAVLVPSLADRGPSSGGAPLLHGVTHVTRSHSS
jgi:hypothetical protein